MRRKIPALKNSFTFPKKRQNRSVRTYSSGLDPEPELFTERQNAAAADDANQNKSFGTETSVWIILFIAAETSGSGHLTGEDVRC